MPDISNAKCADCVFWLGKEFKPVVAIHLGHCHRYAPRIPFSGSWPVTEDKDWCGEFVPWGVDWMTKAAPHVTRESPK